MVRYKVKGKLNIPLGMVDVLYGRNSPPSKQDYTSSSWYQLLLKLKDFGRLSPEEWLHKLE